MKLAFDLYTIDFGFSTAFPITTNSERIKETITDSSKLKDMFFNGNLNSPF